MRISKTLLNDLAAAIESGESVWEVVIPNDTFKGVFKGLSFSLIVSDYGENDNELDIFIIEDNYNIASLTTSKSDSKRVYMDNILNAIKQQTNGNICHA